VVRTVRDDAMPRHISPEALPFGIRRPPEPDSRKLSNLELLFGALAVFALIYLSELGARPDPWIKAAQAELQTHTLLAHPLHRDLAIAEDTERK
jgi:hypothetical protein